MPAAPIELREGLAIGQVSLDRRSAVMVDPIAAQVVAGTWSMPKPGDSVTYPGGQTRRWEPIKAGADGRFSEPAHRAGYLAASVSSPDNTVMILEASGHSLAYVNREPRGGDVYATGYVRLPILLRKGLNTLLFQLPRGPLQARLVVPKAPAFLNTGDVTTPDLVAGEPAESEAAVVVVNAIDAWRDDLSITAALAGGPEVSTPVPSLAPLTARKVGFAIKRPALDAQTGGECRLDVKLRHKASAGSGDGWQTLDSASINLRVRQPGQAHKRTFRSSIDGSLQYFAVVPPIAKPAGSPDHGRPGLVLTLHGAGVEAIGQAEAYAPKPGLFIVAPTNRRPYGFDWEDWGRLDAIEVLERAQPLLATDSRHTYLTGHSMGGHGTWQLGVTFPDRFAAIAPSAGWISMWTYAGAKRAESPGALEKLMARASTPSDTLALVPNLSTLGVYVLHGDADDNVPVGQARRMRQALGEFHPDFAYHEQPGAGHWWGSACVDWPPLFAFLDRRTIPEPADVRRVDFVTASPGVSSRAYWVSIEAQTHAMATSSVHLKLDPETRRFHGTTDNVGRLTLDLGRAVRGSTGTDTFTVELDGQTLAGLSGGKTSSIALARSQGVWKALRSPAALTQKGPHRYGPFKEAFRNRFVLIVGTRGTPEENAWGLARARFDAETFGYRGNGSVDIVADTAFLEPGRKAEFADRNLIVYGHSECNAAWPALLGDSPVQVRRGQAQIGGRTVAGDNLACLFFRPRPGSDQAAVGVVAGSGPVGLRLSERLPYFTSGVAYPDCVVLSAKPLGDAAATTIAAGYFGDDWRVESGEFAWRD